MNLSLLIILPIVTLVALLLSKGLTQARVIAVAGASVQFVLCLALLYFYQQERAHGNMTGFLFEDGYVWYPSLGFNYHIGVDGISVAMILLTAFVVVAGVLVSWNI